MRKNLVEARAAYAHVTTRWTLTPKEGGILDLSRSIRIPPGAALVRFAQEPPKAGSSLSTLAE